jgi:hypothetical protein
MAGLWNIVRELQEAIPARFLLIRMLDRKFDLVGCSVGAEDR